MKGKGEQLMKISGMKNLEKTSSCIESMMKTLTKICSFVQQFQVKINGDKTYRIKPLRRTI